MTTAAAITPEDLLRIEKKLDAIIRHFGVGAAPRRSNQELEKIAREKVLQFNKRKSKSKP